jgi:uncharacterized Fe-S cluster-containing radical SAM superfamily protein
MADGLPILARKFVDPDVTADGKPRAVVAFDRLATLWVNTGTLCNIECAHCYIESSPENDRLAYLGASDLAPFLDEAAALGAREIGFTGGEPFLNHETPAMLRAALTRGFSALVLTNAMRPMMRPRVQKELIALREEFGLALVLRVSLDHYTEQRHDEERGAGAFEASLKGLVWLAANGFRVAVAGRLMWGEDEASARRGYAALFARRGLAIDAADPKALVLFPEMDAGADTPEITTACWEILHKSPSSVMCASSRMLVKRKGATAPVVLACTLIPYDARFELGPTLAGSLLPIKLNHPHCSKFCVLGGASCSAPA